MSTIRRFFCWFISIDWTPEAVTAAGTIALAFLTLVLAAGTLFLWRATRRLVKGSEKTAERQLRAYVGIVDHTLDNLSADQRPQISLIITNFGQTPAHDVKCWRWSQFKPYPLTNGLPELPLPETTFVLFPTDKFIISLTNMGAFNAEEMADLAAGKRHLYVYGHIQYEDVFGNVRNTWFRLMYGGGLCLRIGRMVWAEQGNKAD